MTIKIKETHETLREAVESAKVDLSYNEPLAKRSIRETDEGVEKAFVTESGDVYYIYKCDIRILHKYVPHSHCIDSYDFRLVTIVENDINYHDVFWPKSFSSRKEISRLNALVG